MIEIAIIDDEDLVIDLLEQYIQNYEKANIAGLAGEQIRTHRFKNGVDFLSCNKGFDIAFFDIEMPLMDGLSAAKKFRLKDERCIIIFVTNMAQYAIKGYEVAAMDFVVKPLSLSTFNLKFKKALDVVLRNRNHSIFITRNNSKVRLVVNTIVYVEAYGHKVHWVTTTGDYESWGSLKSVVQELEGFSFSCCNASQLVNLNFVREVNGNQVILYYADKQVVLQITRSKKTEFMDDFTVAFYSGRGRG